MNRIITRLDFSPTHFSKLFRPVPHFVRIQNGTVYELNRNAVRTKPESVYESLRNCQAWIFGAIAILFNPIIPIYFEKEIWIFLDAITAVIFVVSIKTVSTSNN